VVISGQVDETDCNVTVGRSLVTSKPLDLNRARGYEWVHRYIIRRMLPACLSCVHSKYLISKAVSAGHSWKARLDFVVKNNVVLLVLDKY